MPPLYEDAAHTLWFLTNSGLVIRRDIDCRVVVTRLAERMRNVDRDLRDLSHYGAALWILSDLEKQGLVKCERQDRAKILSILGTAIANVSARSPQKSQMNR